MFSPTLSLLSKINASATVDQSGRVTFHDLDQSVREYWPTCSQQAVLMAQTEAIIRAGRNVVANWSKGDLAAAVRELDLALNAIDLKVPEAAFIDDADAPQFDHGAAAADEGWCISLADESDMNRNRDRPFQLQALDEAGVFDGDADAIDYVAQQAAKGSIIHIAALNFLSLHSPAEFLDIKNGAYKTWKATAGESPLITT